MTLSNSPRDGSVTPWQPPVTRDSGLSQFSWPRTRNNYASLTASHKLKLSRKSEYCSKGVFILLLITSVFTVVFQPSNHFIKAKKKVSFFPHFTTFRLITLLQSHSQPTHPRVHRIKMTVWFL